LANRPLWPPAGDAAPAAAVVGEAAGAAVVAAGAAVVAAGAAVVAAGAGVVVAAEPAPACTEDELEELQATSGPASANIPIISPVVERKRMVHQPPEGSGISGSTGQHRSWIGAAEPRPRRYGDPLPR